jgi:hypothetical protein
METAAVLMAGMAAFKRGQSADSIAKPSWWQSLLNGARLIAKVWLAFQSPGSKVTDK